MEKAKSWLLQRQRVGCFSGGQLSVELCLVSVSFLPLHSGICVVEEAVSGLFVVAH